MKQLAHGGSLQNLLLTPKEAQQRRQTALSYPQWPLNTRQLCDLELLLNGGFSPLTGFMNKKDYTSVINTMRLTNGALWPIPITLDIHQALADKLSIGSYLCLTDEENNPLALMQIQSLWQATRQQEALALFGTEDLAHPGVHYLLQQSHPIYVGGPIEGLQMPPHYDVPTLRHTPRQIRDYMAQQSWSSLVGFQTRNPLHRAHFALTEWAMQQTQSPLLLQPVIGMTKPGDIDAFCRIRCYQKLLKYYPPERVCLSLLPLAMRMAGPKEALWHAIIRKNYGCTHFIVGRDHAGPGNDSQGQPFYDPYAAHDLVKQHSAELEINILCAQEFVYSDERKQFFPLPEIAANEPILKISGTRLREMLSKQQTIPNWFSFPDIIKELTRHYRSKSCQGFTVFLTGLSGSGKSTLANALAQRLRAQGRSVTLLDGDVIRHHLCPELGFSRADRELHVKRIGFVASEISYHGGIAICAQIAPYKESRNHVRQLLKDRGGYMEIYLNTPLADCERRDRKGLYAKARKGELQHFTGIDDPYEAPEQAELTLNTAQLNTEACLNQILAHLIKSDYLQHDVD